MRILLTGGGGFLGGYLIPQLLASGVHVTALSRQKRISDHPNLDWIQMDLAEGIDAKKLPKSIDGVIHLAQSPEYRNGPDGEAHVLKVNVVSYTQLLKYAEKANANCFITASTGSVYEPFTGTMLEDSLPKPTGFYGASKLAAENLSHAFSSRMKICNLRIFFLFGPAQKKSFITRLFDTVKTGDTVTLPAEGDGLIFVPTLAKNTANVFNTALQEGWTGTYNVASPHAISVKDMALAVGKASGKTVSFDRNSQGNPSPIVPPVQALSEIYNMENFSTFEDALNDFNFT